MSGRAMGDSSSLKNQQNAHYHSVFTSCSLGLAQPSYQNAGREARYFRQRELVKSRGWSRPRRTRAVWEARRRISMKLPDKIKVFNPLPFHPCFSLRFFFLGEVAVFGFNHNVSLHSFIFPFKWCSSVPANQLQSFTS